MHTFALIFWILEHCDGRPKASSDIVLSNFNFPRVQKKKAGPKHQHVRYARLLCSENSSIKEAGQKNLK